MITMYTPWFGPLPSYANIFLACCGNSKNCRWIVHSDQMAPFGLPENVIWILEFNIHSRIQKHFPHLAIPRNTWHHKLCDLKPFWHEIFHELFIPHTEFRGWADWDTVFNLNRLPTCYDAMVFTQGWLRSPMYVQRNKDLLVVYPVNFPFLLSMSRSSTWDECYYLYEVDPTILQEGMNPELDLWERVDYVIHLHRAKNSTRVIQQWIKDYCKFEVPI